MEFHVRAGDLLSAIVELVCHPPATGMAYYTSSAKLDVSCELGEVALKYEITLVHEPLSEEAAVEEDRLVLVLREDSDVKGLTVQAREFVESHWRC